MISKSTVKLSPCHCVFVVIFFVSKYNKTIIRFTKPHPIILYNYCFIIIIIIIIIIITIIIIINIIIIIMIIIIVVVPKLFYQFSYWKITQPAILKLVSSLAAGNNRLSMY